MTHPLTLAVTLLIIYLAAGLQGIMKNYYRLQDGEEAEDNIWGKIAKKIYNRK